MKARQILLCSFLFCVSLSCNSYKHGLSSENQITSEVHLGSVNNNVCKSLYGRVVLYAIFVDTKGTKPWSEYDITSSLDSIKKAMQWIKKKASENNIYIDIEIHYPENNHKIPIANDFPRKTLSETLFLPNFSAGLKAIQSWSDRIAVSAARTLPPDTSKIITTRNSLSDKERLIARLRDIYKTDNVALMYFVNNYYSDELSVTFNIFSHTSIEYSIVSFKKPAIIAHEFLHLFGAWDLYITLGEKDKEAKERKAFAMKEFPNEIMAFAYRGIDSLDISPFTKYCIGWEKQLSQKYTDMILGKDIKPVKY
jgi:hypothetical protein